MNNRLTHMALLFGFILLVSCKNMPSENHGPIVLGDSSMIVTETDPARLQDMVPDLKPTIASSEPKDTPNVPREPAPPATDTARKAPLASILKPPIAARTQTALSGPGLKTDFSVLATLIPNLNAKLAGNSNLAHATGAVYTFVSGSIIGNMIKVTPNVTKVSQRYQTIVVLKNELGVLPLESLSVTTEWQPLKGLNNIYKISGLEEKSLHFPEADRDDIREAVAKSARRHHMNKKREQEWVKSVRNVRKANQRPLNIMLRSVMWKIDGKDTDGKPISRQIRIDMPI